MNKTRRIKIKAIMERITECREDLEVLKEAEQDCYDNLPEALQDSEKGETIQMFADDLETACDDLDNIVEELEDLVNR